MTQSEKIELAKTAFDMMREPGGKFWTELTYTEQVRWIVMAFAIFNLGVESVSC